MHGSHTDLLTIDARYCGPPNSVHGGVAVGRFAQLVEGDISEVRVIAPPPLATPLTSRTEDDGTVFVSGPDGDVARIRALSDSLDIAPFSRVADAEVDEAAEAFLAGLEEKPHPFPTCFGCGPDAASDALHQYPGNAGDGDSVARFRVPGTGPLPRWLTVAGLDCPSGITLAISDEAPGVAVLGSMTCHLHEDAQAGVDYQVRGRVASIEGRKLTSEVAMLAPDGTTVAEASALWIAVDPTSFGAAPTAASS